MLDYLHVAFKGLYMMTILVIVTHLYRAAYPTMSALPLELIGTMATVGYFATGIYLTYKKRIKELLN